MRRQILSYIPANVVPAMSSVAMIYAYTRMLTVEAYGNYTLAFSVLMIAQAAFLTPLGLGTLRLYVKAEQDGALWSFIRTSYSCLGLIGLATCLLLPLLLLIPATAQDLRLAMALVVPLLLLRGAVSILQDANRMRDRHLRYNLIACGQAGGGLLAGIALILAMHATTLPLGAIAVLTGLMIASAACLASDPTFILSVIREGRFSRDYAVRLFRFCSPVSGAGLTSFLLQYSDRLVVGVLGGAGAAGFYAVAYALVERPTTLLCTSISTATFPMSVRALDHGGIEAARLQTGRNGAALLSLALPACVGLALCAAHITAVMVGPDYRSGALGLIPIMAVTALARGVSVHFVEHVFHLAHRPDVLLRLYAPAAAANVAVSALTVPFFGVTAAAWAALACQFSVMVVAWIQGRKLFPISLPPRHVACSLGSTALMAAVLLNLKQPETPMGLAMMIAAGAATYGIGLFVSHGLPPVLSWRRADAVPAGGHL